jgi:hypothetical protein
MDLDLSTDLSALNPLIEPLVGGRCDLAVGSRLLPGSRVRRSRKRDALSRLYNRLLRMHFPRARFSDAQCGFKAATRAAAEELLPGVRDNAWFFDTELLLQARRKGFRIEEVPIQWTEDPGTKVRLPSTAGMLLKGLWRVRLSKPRRGDPREAGVPAPVPSIGKKAVWLMLVFAALYFADVVYHVAAKPDAYGWDFKTCYWAGKTNATGLNPYGVTALSRVAGEPIRLRYRYPPPMLWFYQVFALFPYSTAYLLFLAFKILLLGILFWIWTKTFLRRDYDLFFFVFALFAFNASICTDLMAGNISILEEIGIWLAVAFFLKRKLTLFCLCLVVISCIKITPLFFLVLLFFIPERRKYAYFFGSLAAFAAIQAVCLLVWKLYEDFLFFGPQVQADFGERGFENPSSYSFLADAMNALGIHWRTSHQWRMHMILYAILCAVLLAAAWKKARAVQRLPGLEPFERDRLLIILAVLTYVLVCPRFMAYSQMVLIAPAYLIVKRMITRSEAAVLFLGMAALQSRGYGVLPGMNGILELFWNYYEITLAAIMWFWVIRAISLGRRSGRIPGFSPSAEAPLSAAGQASI